jgi:hypothetical protein
MTRGEGASVLHDSFVLLYAGTVGFVSGGIIASFYQWMTSEPARFGLFGRGLVAVATTFIFCAFTGPVIIVGHALKSMRGNGQPVGLLLGSIVVAGMWSCCSGIVMLQFVFSLRETIA